MMQRRQFIQACAVSAVATSLPALSQENAKPRFYGRARLVDGSGKPLLARALAANRNYIFHYPFAGTPCFLLNLGKPVKAAASLKTADAKSYQWNGGIGPGSSIVAYSAICAHKLTYPTRDISFISYRPDASVQNKLAQVIHCCSEHSQYDPAAGGKVLAGPAPQPLAAILLEHDSARDELYAVGTLGGEMFNEFFSKFEFRLAVEHGGRAKSTVEGSCVVSELTQYCRQQIKC
ncbi:MAG: Rieske 2Fe-2S domain-containing protein [Proteobacteria bacterium]|nr:Rieske 2Fe-2S domain-containing protein [Pseudomonadota bacterium]